MERKRGKKRFSLRSFILITGFFLCALLFIGWKFLFTSSLVSPLPSAVVKGYMQKVQQKTFKQQLEGALAEKHIQFVSVTTLPDSSLLLLLSSSEEILFSSKKSIDGQISSLQLIMSRFTIEGKRFTKLDLRFNKPIIVMK